MRRPARGRGETAKAYGLDGQVDAEAFAAVLSGVNPSTGERLKPHANKTVHGWDLTFSPPKSVSALWALAPHGVQGQVRAAQQAAVRAALDYIERHACVARLGRDGIDRQPAAGFLTAAFDHRTSREGDPQLHTHAVVANVVQAAGRPGRGALFWRHRFAADAVYLTGLRAELTRRLGLGGRRGGECGRSPASPPGSTGSSPNAGADRSRAHRRSSRRRG